MSLLSATDSSQNSSMDITAKTRPDLEKHQICSQHKKTKISKYHHIFRVAQCGLYEYIMVIAIMYNILIPISP